MSALQSFDPFADGILASARWLRIMVLLSGVAGLSALVSLARTALWSRRTPRAITLLFVLLAAGAGFAAIWSRYVEVNHFPSQTMSEVLAMSGWIMLLALFTVVNALQLERIGWRWTALADGLIVIIAASEALLLYYSSTLSTAQRDLPPALQSYWFPPHLVSLIFSYTLLFIAGVVTIVYFCMRFWGGVLRGGRSLASQLAILALMTLVPFAHWMTAPLLLLVGLVLVLCKAAGVLPERAFFQDLEKKMDVLSYRSFSIGIPFLTAGLFMGAFWAQDAWANYWGWDSKENSALITWLVYVVYIHLRMLGGYRGEKAMAVLMGGALSVLITFQLFGYMPDSQKSLHRYTDDGVTPREGMQGATAEREESARLEEGR